MSWTVIVISLCVLIVILWIIGIYNRLVRLRNEVKNSWSQIDVQLERRYDLIPNLVETVKGYMTYEQGTLQKVVDARNQAKGALDALHKQGGPTEGSLKDLVQAEAGLKSTLGGIFALAENYPTLKAAEPMQRLQEELSSTENKVAFSRQAYNDVVLVYNTTQQQFPTNIFAGAFGHRLADLFELEDQQARKAVKVQF